MGRRRCRGKDLERRGFEGFGKMRKDGKKDGVCYSCVLRAFFDRVRWVVEMKIKSVSMLVGVLLHLVVENQHDGGSNASPEVGQVSLEEASDSLSR